MRRPIENIKRIVIKVGSNSLCDDQGQIDREKVLSIIAQIVTLRRQGYTVLLVSSGAIAAGMGHLELDEKPKLLAKKQALAAIGQARLMEIYEELFGIFGVRCAQVLLNHGDFDDRKRLIHLQQTMSALIDYDVVPIINENDALAVEEIKVGDNDTLAALIVPVIEAELLILASDIDGLYNANPRTHPQARLIHYVDHIDDEIRSYADQGASTLGTGGMLTKLKAAEVVTAYGSHMCIVNAGKEKAIVNALQDEGTWFEAKDVDRLKARAHWIFYRSRSKGTLIVDDGCARALKKHSSLLPKGIIDVKGDFLSGQVVDVMNHGKKIGRGITNYPSDEIRLIKGHKTDEIEGILHYKDYDEVIHANNMVMMEG